MVFVETLDGSLANVSHVTAFWLRESAGRFNLVYRRSGMPDGWMKPVSGLLAREEDARRSAERFFGALDRALRSGGGVVRLADWE